MGQKDGAGRTAGVLDGGGNPLRLSAGINDGADLFRLVAEDTAVGPDRADCQSFDVHKTSQN
jgi:hypothetical protein